jgi:hypothetical protein
MELTDLVPGVIIGLLIGGGLAYYFTSNSLNKQIDLLGNEVDLLNQEVTLLKSQLDLMENEVDELEEDKRDLQSQVSSKSSEILSLNSEVYALKGEILDLSEQILEYERESPKITMVETGTAWREAGDYDLQDSFQRGYDDDFFVIYEIENHHHELIYRVSMDIYIVSGGTIYFAEHWTDEGTYPYEYDWYHSYYYPVDIQWLSNNFYTVIVTVTDLITGESNSKSNSFEITL